ncbi:glycosyltransferase family 9 protein [Acidipila sp. EB88]|uniref:glycosyltransferase family 9 protein n=1 Tax=Acidipila sp. EB88 TaxID=2305226 RepID=UPI000F5DD62D|nr:glycosyltransferase family 9 protein [Acidipila sp. EB88]RRA49676.1 glycosyltransferase family 9 protein [Acidipila sp. EB88]
MATANALSDPAARSRVRRILIYRLGSLGDTMVVLPSLHLVARLFPNAERRMLSNHPVHGKAAPASAILDHSGLITGYMSYAVGTRNPWTLAKIALSIRVYRPDLLVYLTKPRGEAVIARDRKFFQLICGVRNIVGLPVGTLGENLPPQGTGGLWESEAARLARSVAALGPLDVNDLSNWDLRLTPEEQAKAAQALAPLAGKALIACGPGTKMQAKDWGAASWRALLDKLAAAHPEHGLILVGAKDDASVSDEVSTGWSGRVLNLCGALAPRVTAAALARTELFLGPDSGPMHFAAAAGVPCAIAFASRTEPGIWYPAGHGHRVVYHPLPCSNCDLEVCTVNQKRCLTSISPDEMFQAAEAAWRDGRARSTAAAAYTN